MNQSDSCGDTATSESQEPDVGESQHDPLRTRIAAVQLGHMPDDYERDLGQCRCGFKYQKHWDLASHVADAVIRELAGSDCIYRYACHRCGDFWFDKSERMQRFALLHGKAHTDD